MAGKKYKGFISVTSVFIALVISVFTNVSAFDFEENSNERQELNQETAQYQQQLQETQKTIAEKKEYSNKLQKQILDLSNQVKYNNDRIDKLNSDIKQKQIEIDEKLATIQDRLDLLRKRLRQIYLAGDTSSLEILLGAKNFSDLIDKTELIQRLADYDDNLIQSLQAQMETISKEQKSLKNDKQNVEKEKKNLEKNIEKINKLSEENENLIKELTETEEELKKSIEENKKKQDLLNEELEKYNKELAEQARKNQELQSMYGEIVVSSLGNKFIWPCPGHTYLTSSFDENRGASNHGALDIADGSIYGSKVVACYDGVVFSTNTGCPHDYGKFSSCGCGGGYGNYVMIDHGNGKISIYGHLSGVTVNAGDKVVGGQLIGLVGSTGYSTGPHLHFEMRYNGVRYNPLIEYNINSTENSN